MSEPSLQKESGENDKLFVMRFEYAWRYFEFHAKQRTIMFNFFLIFSGFFIGACAKLLAAKEYVFLLTTLIFGMLITLMFIFLDRRTRNWFILLKMY